MKANLLLIAISLVAVNAIYFINNQNHHWLEIPFLLYIVYGFVIGIISAFRKR
jgi:hypothetical protein